MGKLENYTIEFMDGKTKDIDTTYVMRYEDDRFVGTGVGAEYLMECLKETKPIIIAKEIGTKNIEEIINTTNIRNINPIES